MATRAPRPSFQRCAVQCWAAPRTPRRTQAAPSFEVRSVLSIAPERGEAGGPGPGRLGSPAPPKPGAPLQRLLALPPVTVPGHLKSPVTHPCLIPSILPRTYCAGDARSLNSPWLGRHSAEGCAPRSPGVPAAAAQPVSDRRLLRAGNARLLPVGSGSCEDGWG